MFKKILLITAVTITLPVIATAFFLIYTPMGKDLRFMIGGSIISSQHSEYAQVILSPQEYNQMEKTYQNPPVVDSLNPIPTVKIDSSKKDQSIRVDTINTTTYTAKILIVNDPTTIHLVKTKLDNKGQALSVLMEENKAVAGINAGGFYDSTGKGSGGDFIGIAIGDGQVFSKNMNQDQKTNVFGFIKDGTCITGNYSIKDLLQMNVTQAVSFGPQLIVDHKDVVDKDVNQSYGWAPRTAIGQDEDGNVIMVITDGRFFENISHRGASIEDLVKVFQKYNAKNAYALDGGGSTTMIYQGKLQMKPATNTAAGMRYLPDAFVVIPNPKNTKISCQLLESDISIFAKNSAHTGT
jgi:exopolysaccharide biosynthesis protein